MEGSTSSSRRPMKRRLPLAAAALTTASILLIQYAYIEEVGSKIPDIHNHLHQNLREEEDPPSQRRLDECYETENNWHLAMKGKNTCSNDITFPKSWASPSMSRFFQPTCHDCCREMFPKLDPTECACKDFCNQGGGDEVEEEPEEECTGPCCTRYWHPDLNAEQPFTCTNTYTNDGSYPSYWNDNPLMVGTSMFETADGCCEKLTKGESSKCVKVEADDCNEGGGSNESNLVTTTSTPTSKPTPTPTPKPTPTPTPKPTLLLTIPPHLLTQEATPRPTLHLTIPPFLLTPVETPRPTLHLTVPPFLLTPPTNPPTNPPQDDVQQYFPNQDQDYCSRIQRRRRCRNDSKCEFVRGSCRATNNDPLPVISEDICSAGFKWHRGKPSQGSMCSNDRVYPLAWDDPQHTDRHLFDTAKECCLAHFTLETCTAINACGEQQTVGSSCSGKRRGKCKLDSNCSWKRAPRRECVDAVSGQ